MKQCSIDTCNKVSSRAGMCFGHYKKKLKYGDPLHGKKHPRNEQGLCLVEGCQKPYTAKGLCCMHWNRLRRTGKIGTAGKIARVTHIRTSCLALGCSAFSRHANLCIGHYRQSRNTRKECSVSGCKDRYSAKGYCKFHYKRNLAFGDPLAGAPRRKHRNLSIGHRIVTYHGYVMILVGRDNIHANKYRYAWEHRMVMGEHLGRRLYDFENVHHKDGNRQNNALENLELWVTMQPSGQRPSDLVEYAKRILSLYGNMA